MNLNLTPDRIWPMVAWFIGLVGIHITLVVWRDKIKKILDTNPTDVELMKKYKIAYWCAKLWPFVCVIFLIFKLSQ